MTYSSTDTFLSQAYLLDRGSSSFLVRGGDDGVSGCYLERGNCPTFVRNTSHRFEPLSIYDSFSPQLCGPCAIRSEIFTE